LLDVVQFLDRNVNDQVRNVGCKCMHMEDSVRRAGTVLVVGGGNCVLFVYWAFPVRVLGKLDLMVTALKSEVNWLWGLVSVRGF
jgi:hypothetical protein